MKKLTWKAFSLICAAVLFAGCFSACGTDPNVSTEEEQKASYKVESGAGSAVESEREGFHAYGNGKTDPVTVNGTEINVMDYAVRSYELAYLLASPDFDSPASLPVDALAQYAFAHHLFPNLNEMNNKPMEYRSATEEELNAALQAQFGKLDVDLKKSVLYNPQKKIFEMWLPEYGCNIYYTIDAVNTDKDSAEIITTFYNELKRESMRGRTTMTVKVKDGKPVIAALKTE